MRHQRLRRRRLWRRQPVRLAVGHLLSHRGDPRLRGARAGSLASQCTRPPADFSIDRRALRGYLGPSDSRPLATFAERSLLRELGAVRVLDPPFVDVGLQVADGRADRELEPTTCCSLSGSSLMTTRSASENPFDTRNGAPFSTIFMTYSPWSSTTKPFNSGDDHRTQFMRSRKHSQAQLMTDPTARQGNRQRDRSGAASLHCRQRRCCVRWDPRAVTEHAENWLR